MICEYLKINYVEANRLDGIKTSTCINIVVKAYVYQIVEW